jgi:uncharacterized iron-regulated membrane protein
MASISPIGQEEQRQETRRGVSWNRVCHRVGGLIASLLMLYLAVTGATMQVLDLHAILTRAPQSDATVESMDEGRYGPAQFAVIQNSDFDAPPLPAGFDIATGLATVLQAAHEQANHAGGLAPMAWVELRMADGIPIGQVMLGSRLVAFNALTADPVVPVPSKGLALDDSLRQTIKYFHRFWSHGTGDVPGVYFELLSGLIMWSLLITGLSMYFKLLRTRSHQGRSQLFWTRGGGGSWRSLHRIVSVAASVFIMCIAFSGTWIGFESVVNALRRGSPLAAVLVQANAEQAATQTQGQKQAPGRAVGGRGPGRRNPLDFIIPLRDQEVQDMTAMTLRSMQLLYSGTPIKVIRLRIYGQMKQGVVVAGGKRTTQLVFNADTGGPVTLSEGGYPESGFPFGTQVHENIKHFHSGDMFGLPSRLMNLCAGFSLMFLSVSGLAMYFDIWRKRRNAGRNGLFWV